MSQPQLVRFEHAPFHGTLGLQQRSGHAIGKVGSCTIARDALALALQRIGNHISNSGFPVGAHHDNGAFGDFVHRLGDNARIDFQGNLARHISGGPMRQVAQTPRAQRACHISHCLANAHDIPFTTFAAPNIKVKAHFASAHDTALLRRTRNGRMVAHRNSADFKAVPSN